MPSIPANHPCVAQALERGLVSREALGLAPPVPPRTSRPTATAVPDSPRWAVILDVPCVVLSEPNERCHWTVRHRRFREQGEMLAQVWRASPLSCLRLAPHWQVKLPLRVTFTRLGKQKLDDDNLSAAFKGLRDKLAGLLGMDDGDERLEWAYAQDIGTPGVVVRIEPKEQG